MKRILFVDDEPNVLDGLRRMLRPMREEWEIACASGGEEALAILAEEPFDVVVSDMRMPGMDGAQLLSEVKQRYPQVIRVVLSGYSEKETILRSVGPTHQYLAKPCDPEQLRDVIGRACALRDLLSEDTLRGLVSQMSTIPSLPQTYTEIIEELQSPDASIKKVGQIHLERRGDDCQDPATRELGLLRTASSRVRSVASGGVSLASTHSRRWSFLYTFSRSSTMSRLRDSLSTRSGTTVRRLEHWPNASPMPRVCAEHIRDHALLAGLLHDAGKLVIAANLPERYGTVLASAKDEELDLWEAERQILTNTHAEVGAYLFGLWGLPDSIVEAVAFHHDPSKCAGTGFTPLVAVHAANAIDHEHDPTWKEQSTSLFDMEYIAQLGLADRLPAWRELYTEVLQEKAGK